MTDREILDKAFDKAKTYRGTWIQLNNIYDSLPINGIIFSHSFAKAFWGEGRTNCKCDRYGDYCPECFLDYKWQYHLQQMVLEENPLKYLEKFL